MKKKIVIGVGVVAFLLVGLSLFRVYTKSHSPVAEVVYRQNGAEIKVVYCQPSKKGRVIFGDASEKALQPYGAYWRVGANEATTFESNKDLKINGEEVKAGKYQLYAVPGKDTWKIYLNTEWDRWGAAEADHKTDVLETEVPVTAAATSEEQLKISFPDGSNTLLIHWDQAEVKVPIVVQ